ncbi:MAG: hypothetical protein D6740_07850 [Alphaproteobacteria bacterium]|nr:MAG: hypothetical protein D6740_07850 [Alphaproteobacteria bacterium]
MTTLASVFVPVIVMFSFVVIFVIGLIVLYDVDDSPREEQTLADWASTAAVIGFSWLGVVLSMFEIGTIIACG